jgi:cytochrome P450
MGAARETAGSSVKDKPWFGRILATARDMIDSRMGKSVDGRSAMLALVVRHGLSRDEVFTEVLLQIPAESDTTATAIRSIIL